MKHLKQLFENEDNSLEKLVENILESCKLDVHDIKEADPDFVGYISDMIQKWHNEQNNKL
jgi:hypothetical protein